MTLGSGDTLSTGASRYIEDTERLLTLADALAAAVEGVAAASALVVDPDAEFDRKQEAHYAWGSLVNALHAYRAARP